jgi:AcrR family transcriptional regulator
LVRRTQQQRRAESDRRILRAASELIVAQGFSATTLEQIGTRAGYSRGLVSQKFGSKEGLVHAVVTQAHQKMYETLDAAIPEDATGLEAILHIVDVYVTAFSEAQVQADPDTYIAVQAYYVLQAESIGVVPETRAFFLEANQTFRARLESHLRVARRRHQARGNLDVRAAATLIQCTLSGVVLLWLVERESFYAPSVRKEVVETVRRMIAA